MSRLWIVPLLALVLTAGLGYRAWVSRGHVFTVRFADGHGLRAGDDVRYRGIAVGQVRDVRLAGDFEGVVVRAALASTAKGLAREGTRLWVVRPKLDVTGVAGLETLIGPRYLALLPGDGAVRDSFVGLADPPVVESIGAGDLEIILHAPRRGGLRVGAPLLYRQVPVGQILSVGLSADGGGVEARAHVREAYTVLIRPQTRFWNAGGFTTDVGLSGVSVEMDSLEALLAGGVALATPPAAAPPVRNGHRFPLAEKPESEWLHWQPMIALGNPFLPPGTVMSAPARAVLAWRSGWWLKSDRTRRGWVLPTPRGLLGPADLLRPELDADRKEVALEVAGEPVALPADGVDVAPGVARIDVGVPGKAWPDALRRTATEPEDCVAVADRAAAPLPLSATRLAPSAAGWRIDPAIAVGDEWHGACVLGHRDGRLIGMVLVDEDGARVALVPAPE